MIIELCADNFEDPGLLRERLISCAKNQIAESDYTGALNTLNNLQCATIDDKTLEETDQMLRNEILSKKRFIATCDPHRTARQDERVIVYGNYPYYFENLLLHQVCRRHVSLFWMLRHDCVESDDAWKNIDQIFIINKDSRVDRFDAVLNELARARAPFDRITRVSATVLDSTQNDSDNPLKDATLRGSMGCIMSHIEVLERASALEKSNYLVLEDDFCFTTDIDFHLRDLKLFFSREYDFWICLLATSKHGLIVQKDDLLSYSLQPCTNAAAYLISQCGIKQLLPVWKAALKRMKETGDYHNNAADRSWSVLQKYGKFLVFKNKMGFQMSSYSNIESNIARYFD